MTTNLHDSFICSFSQIYFKIKILKAYKISLKILLTIVNEKKRNTKVMKIVFWKFVSQHHYSGMFIFVSCCNKKASLPIESLFWWPEKFTEKKPLIACQRRDLNAVWSAICASALKEGFENKSEEAHELHAFPITAPLRIF